MEAITIVLFWTIGLSGLNLVLKKATQSQPMWKRILAFSGSNILGFIMFTLVGSWVGRSLQEWQANRESALMSLRQHEADLAILKNSSASDYERFSALNRLYSVSPASSELAKFLAESKDDLGHIVSSGVLTECAHDPVRARYYRNLLDGLKTPPPKDNRGLVKALQRSTQNHPILVIQRFPEAMDCLSQVYGASIADVENGSAEIIIQKLRNDSKKVGSANLLSVMKVIRQNADQDTQDSSFWSRFRSMDRDFMVEAALGDLEREVIEAQKEPNLSTRKEALIDLEIKIQEIGETEISATTRARLTNFRTKIHANIPSDAAIQNQAVQTVEFMRRMSR